MGSPDVDRYTVDELAAQTGIPTSTLRLYRHRGLIDPPEREGRRAFYGRDHLRQLDVIARLKDRGYSLASIQEMVELYRRGGSLESILGREVARGPTVDLSDLVAALFPDGEVDPEIVARAARLGLIEITDDGVALRDPMDLEHGSALIRLGVPAGVVLDEYEHLRTVTDELAQRFADLFERYVVDHSDNLVRDMDSLVRLAAGVIEVALTQSLRSEAQERIPNF